MDRNSTEGSFYVKLCQDRTPTSGHYSFAGLIYGGVVEAARTGFNIIVYAVTFWEQQVHNETPLARLGFFPVSVPIFFTSGPTGPGVTSIVGRPRSLTRPASNSPSCELTQLVHNRLCLTSAHVPLPPQLLQLP